MGIFQTVKDFGKKMLETRKDYINNPRPVGTVSNFVIPLSPAARGASAVGGAARGLSNLFKRATSNPFAGVTVKQGMSTAGKSVAGGALKGAQIGAASAGAYSLASGEPLSFKHLAKSTAYGVTFGISLPGALAGWAAGTGKTVAKNVGKEVKSMVSPTTPYGKSQIGVNDDKEALLTQLDWLKHQVTNTSHLPSFAGGGSPLTAPVNIQMTAPSAPTAPGFSFSPSVSAGGGMGEILPLLLLLGAGAGAAGYAIGKRKRKKYKKRRRRR